MKITMTILGDQELIARFERKVAAEPMSGCFIWTGAPGSNRPNEQYGRFRVRGTQLKAHRAAWMLYVGDIPSGLHVLHRCDNPACVRPSHLFLGTNYDNVADRVAKRRSGWVSRPGIKHPLHVLTEDQVRSIRARYAAGELGKDLAAAFDINKATVSEIVTRRKWAHLT